MTDKQGGTDGGTGERAVNRRDVLQGAATGAATLAGVTAFSGSASAGSCVTLTFEDAPDDFPMVEDGQTRGDFPQGPDELTIFVHGWFEEIGGDAVGQSYLTRQALRDAGYSGAVAGLQYRGNNPWWWEAKDEAEVDGRDFADWLSGYMRRYPGTDIRLVAHSMGGHTTLACLDELQARGQSITSLSLLGAAVDATSVTTHTSGWGWWEETETGRFYDAVAYGADEVYNFHSESDAILEYIYSIGEFGDEAIGDDGSEGSPPGNFADVNVTDKIGDHCEYFQPGTGCMGEVVRRF